jgi:ubiquitin carboxyl-terminal hydrolase 14
MFKVNIKWGKETFKDVELDTEQDAETFMTQLYALSNVPVDKQKIMVKGAKLKPDTDLKTLKLKDGMTIMMIGTAEGKFLKEPENKTVFLEDLTPEQKAKIFKEKTGKALPAGLVNLGNT